MSSGTKKREIDVRNLIKKNQLMITALAIMLAIAGYLQFAGTNIDEEYLENTDAVADASEVISENLTIGEISDSYDIDGILDLSEEDVQPDSLTDIDSLDSDVEVVMEDYLEEDMVVEGEVAEVTQSDITDGTVALTSDSTTDGTVALTSDATTDTTGVVAEVEPEDGEVPGEAVFTSSNGVVILSEARLLKEQVRAKNKETLLEIINSTGLTDAQKQEATDSLIKMTNIAEKEAAAEILLEAKGFADVVVSINGDSVDVVVNALELTDTQRAQIEDIVKRKAEIGAENIVISTVVE